MGVVRFCLWTPGNFSCRHKKLYSVGRTSWDWVDVVSNSTVRLFFKDALASQNRAFSLHFANIYVNLLEQEKGFT